MDSASRLRIVVLGYVVRRPLGGGTWPTLEFAAGLSRLGHDVWFVEDSHDYAFCYDPRRYETTTDPTYGLEYASRIFDRTGLSERWLYYDAHRDRWHGAAEQRAAEVCSEADLVINVSGINPLRPWLREVPRRAWIDTDPAFEQVRLLEEADRRELALQHNVFFTLGENIPRGTARVPDAGIVWQPARQPVVLDLWPVTPGPRDGRFTTVMLWDSYAVREHGGFRFGMKSESFEPYAEMPQRTDAILELALGSANAPCERLFECGWAILNPLVPTRDPWTYQRYIQSSCAELTVAKHGYVVSNSGWFSERSAHYLASGRPVVTQETGFSEWLQCDAGLLSFTSPDEALASIEAVRSDYGRHCAAARDVAAEWFDSNKVLADLVDRAMRS